MAAKMRRFHSLWKSGHRTLQAAQQNRCRLQGLGRRRFGHGVTSIEYALIGALIAMVIVVAVGGVGTRLGDLYMYVKDRVNCAVNGGPGC